MIPQILITESKTKLNHYIKKLIDDQKISSYDVIEIKPFKDEIIIGQIRDLKKQLDNTQTKTRLVILYNLDRSDPVTQNSLLKTLEEKTEFNQFILVVENIGKILPTLQSRSKIINLNESSESSMTIKNKNELSDTIIRIIVAKDISFLGQKELQVSSKSEYLNFSNQLLLYFRDQLRSGQKDQRTIIKIIKKILYLNNLIENNNLNVQLTLDNLLIFIWKNSKMILKGNKVTR
jgi:DNA polymerase III delta prime subunit